MRRLLLSLVPLFVLFLFTSLSQYTPFAAEESQPELALKPRLRVDQSNPQPNPSGAGYGGGLFGQTFIPKVNNLAKVDLLIYTVYTLTHPYTTTLGLYTDITLDPISKATEILTPSDPVLIHRTVSYEFDPPVTLTPGRTYTLGWTGGYPLQWQFSSRNYRRGEAVFSTGEPITGTLDFVFTTYYWSNR